jgi:N-acetylglucosaminyldiphosphoundecaprenol N-acetyl-beta-D-mannosaminyltransferase
VTVCPRTQRELLEDIARGVGGDGSVVIPNHNLHSAALVRKDEELRRFFHRHPKAHIDGMALVLWGRLLGLPLRREHRVTYVDLIGPLMELAGDRGWRVFHLGGRPGVAERAAVQLRNDYGVELQVHHGYFEPEASTEIIEVIEAARPDLVLVGMGMPRQERWLQQHLPDLPRAVYLCSGACFDFLAGEQKTPPRWSGALGIEWLFRLASQPRRLASRYLIEPFALLPEAAVDLGRAWQRFRGRDPGLRAD